MAKLQSLTIFAIAAFVFAGIPQIIAADKEKAKALLEAIEELVKALVDGIAGYNLLFVEFNDEYIPILRPYQTWEESSVKLIQAMIEENDVCKLTKSEAQKKFKNIFTSLDQAKTESDKVAEGLHISEQLQQTINLHVAYSKTNINDYAERLYAELPEKATTC